MVGALHSTRGRTQLRSPSPHSGQTALRPDEHLTLLPISATSLLPFSSMTSTSSLHPQKAIHAQSLADRESFWLKAANDVHWHRRPDRAFGPSQRGGDTPRHGREGDGVWFPGGQISTTFNCLDRHVYPPPTPHSPPLTPSPHTPHLPFDPSLAKRVAFRHISPLPWQTVQERTITYGDALENVQVLAGILKSKGVGKGDVVTVYMSESIETALAILAITRIGAVFSVVFGGFASKELAKRIEDSKCKMIITSSCGLEPKGVSLCRYLNRLPPCMVSR